MSTRSRSQLTFAIAGFTLFLGGLVVCAGNVGRVVHVIALLVAIVGAILADLGIAER